MGAPGSLIGSAHRLVSIDPGKDTGLAYWEAGRLAQVLVVDADAWEPATVWNAEDLVIELPCDRPGLRVATVDDLITLAFRAGRVAGCFCAARRRLVKPHEWKGQLPKAVCADRVRKALAPLELAELDDSLERIAPSLRHNALDAVGLGLYALGRWPR